MKKFTILTTTYNRAATLNRLFNSLVDQTRHDFSWLIIDDGSLDRTKEVIAEMIESSPPFVINYYHQVNGGKHRAINYALGLAKSKYLFIVDSDDYLPKNSIETISKWVDSLKNSNKKFIGVSGLKSYPNDDIVGKTFKGNYVDCTDLERYKHQIIGDKAEVYILDELKKYRFPEITGEKFLTEAVLWNRIAKDGYYLRQFNEIIYYCEYLDDGLTKNIDSVFMKNFKGYTLYTEELLSYNVSIMMKIRALVAYCYRAKMNNINIYELTYHLKISKFKLIWAMLLVKAYEKLKKLKHD